MVKKELRKFYCENRLVLGKASSMTDCVYGGSGQKVRDDSDKKTVAAMKMSFSDP